MTGDYMQRLFIRYVIGLIFLLGIPLAIAAPVFVEVGGQLIVPNSILPAGATLTYNLGSSTRSWANIDVGDLDSAGQSRISITDNATSIYTSEVANSGTNAAHSFRSQNTLSASTRIVEFHNDSAAATPESFVLSDGSILPGTTNGADIGSAANKWNQVFAQILADAGSVSRFDFQSTTIGNTYRGGVTNGATAVAHQFYNLNTLSTAGAKVAQFANANASGNVSFIDFQGFYITPVQTLTVADDGAGTNATATLTPTSAYVNCTCNDANACDITMGETGVQDGTIISVISSTTTACNFADSAGISETAGAFAAGQYDSIKFIYLSDRWVELSRSNN